MTDETALTLTINGRDHTIAVEARRTLADAIREDCGQTGTHIGCDTTSCGACTIVVDGMPCASILYQKTGPSPPFGARMPRSASALSDADRKLIHDWIAEGAQND